MRLAPRPEPRRTSENVIPMINVVFLLLVFFLVTARIAPSLPVDIAAPEAAGQDFDADPEAVVIGPDGTIYFGGETGEAALSRLAETSSETPVPLRVDREMEASALAKILRRISDAAPVALSLVVEN